MPIESEGVERPENFDAENDEKCKIVIIMI